MYSVAAEPEGNPGLSRSLIFLKASTGASPPLRSLAFSRRSSLGTNSINAQRERELYEDTFLQLAAVFVFLFKEFFLFPCEGMGVIFPICYCLGIYHGSNLYTAFENSSNLSYPLHDTERFIAYAYGAIALKYLTFLSVYPLYSTFGFTFYACLGLLSIRKANRFLLLT